MNKTIDALSAERALKLALEALEVWKGYYATHWDKSDEQAITAIREALANKCVCGEPDTPGTHRTDGPCLAEQSAEIPQSITCPFCESQHVPGWLHDYNMDRMKKPANANAGKPWVGLTPEECKFLAELPNVSPTALVRLTEAKLREKNT